MKTVLKNIIPFTGLVVGVPVSLPHGLNIHDGAPVLPQLGGADASGFIVTADTINVTVTRTADATSGDVSIYVEHWHTTEEVLELPGQLTGLVPFFFAAGGGGSVGPTGPTGPAGAVYTADDFTAVDAAPVPIDPDLDGAVLHYAVGGEGIATFTLANAAADHLISITVNVNVIGAGGGTIRVTVPNLNDIAPVGNTFTVSTQIYAGLTLLFHNGGWFVVDRFGFTGPT